MSAGDSSEPKSVDSQNSKIDKLLKEKSDKGGIEVYVATEGIGWFGLC